MNYYASRPQLVKQVRRFKRVTHDTLQLNHLPDDTTVSSATAPHRAQKKEIKTMTHRVIAVLFLSLSWNLPALANGGHGSGPSPDLVLKELEAGNKRFTEGRPLHLQQDVARRTELAKGQNPGAVVLSCADSRVPPELLFDKGLGELFTIRVAGNTLGAGVVSSIEYAVEHLGTRLIVVMGHESCGAVQAALSTPPDQSAGSHDLDFLVSSIRPAIEGISRSIASEDKSLRGPVTQNVNYVVKGLLDRSAIVRKKVESGSVRIVPSIYSLKTGRVVFWNSPTTQSHGTETPAHAH